MLVKMAQSYKSHLLSKLQNFKIDILIVKRLKLLYT